MEYRKNHYYNQQECLVELHSFYQGKQKAGQFLFLLG